MFSRFFHKARNFQITGGNFNQVQGDQYNNYSTTIVQAKEGEPSEFDEYFKVKLGAIFKLRDVGSSAYPRRWDDGRQGKGARAAGNGVYDAAVQWTRCTQSFFGRLSDAIETSNALQIYGYSKSSIPSLILYNELAPASQLNGIIGLLGEFYLGSVAAQLGCGGVDELWIDTGRGIICRGPLGPPCLIGLLRRWFGESDVPLAAELLQSDVLLRFAASLKLKQVDRYVISDTALHSSQIDGPVRVSQPTVISKSTDTPIAVAANNAWESIYSNLSDRKVLDNGLTRSTLTGDPRHILLEWNETTNLKSAWISQARRVFHNRGIPLEDDLSLYYLVFPYASIWVNLEGCSEAQLKRQSQQPIYLFVRPPPSDLGYRETSSLHYWSFHEEGRSPLSPDTCRGLGLPNALELHYELLTYSWSSKDYQRIHQYQHHQGFDPSTMDFARHLGYDDIFFQPVNDSARFEIHQGAESPPESRPSTPASDVQVFKDLAFVEPTTRSGTSGTPLGSTTFWSPAFLPSATEVSSELDTLDVDVD
ncbi:hypothetical protein PQX77_011145 [Marasmius sp. AFHP31]|nr:hypothetical protein PQX77_011145 [Marasmius sp. AFHP31]